MEKDLEAELAAVEAVYGSDCRVIQRFPPRIHLHTRPRTADDISQQFVGALLEVYADVEYPVVPPQVRIIDSKGLDGVRQQHLIEAIKSKGKDLSSFPMLVSLCEEAIEILSSMNHPDGNCPLCLVPLHFEGGDDPHTPFMKLMSCFHCFHSDCILRWWRWLELNHVSTDELINGRGLSKLTGQSDRKNIEHGGFCPVCRKVFHVEDIEHVLKLLKPSSSQMDVDEVEVGVDEDILNSETERLRREKYEAALKVQEERDGLIKPKKEATLQPGMFLPKQEVSSLVKTNPEEEQASSDKVDDPSSSSIERRGTSDSSTTNEPSKSSSYEHKSSSMKMKNKAHSPKRHTSSKQANAQFKKQWMKKEMRNHD